VTGAAVVPVELVHAMGGELGFSTVLTAYGLTESCGTVTMCRRTDPAELARRHQRRSEAEQVDFFLRLFLQGDVPAASRTRLLEYARNAHNNPVPVYWTAQDAADQRVRSLCHLVLTLPEFQLD